MQAKKILSLLIVALVALSIGACNSDDVKDIVEYNLTIVNNTDTAYDVWIDNPLSDHGFYHAGHVAATQKTIIHELDIGIHYKVHLALENEPADPGVHEKSIHSNDADVTWTINP